MLIRKNYVSDNGRHCTDFASKMQRILIYGSLKKTIVNHKYDLAVENSK